MTPDVDQTHKDKQKLKAELRTNFLKKLTQLNNKPCTLNMFENTKVSGTFRGTDVELNQVLIGDLVTPTGVVPHAIVRGSDLIAVEFVEESQDNG